MAADPKQRQERSLHEGVCRPFIGLGEPRTRLSRVRLCGLFGRTHNKSSPGQEPEAANAKRHPWLKFSTTDSGTGGDDFFPKVAKLLM